MRIATVEAFAYDIAYSFGAYNMSDGRSQAQERSLVLRLTADDGSIGWGETCPHGGTYLPAFFEGEVEAARILSNVILGADPGQHMLLYTIMRKTLVGGMAAKSAIDVACWDLVATAARRPAAEMLGGVFYQSVPAFVPVSLDTAKHMQDFAAARKSEGFRDFQLKVGNDPHEDITRVEAVLDVLDANCRVIADANGGWNVREALIAGRALRDLPVHLEQPCEALSDCGEVARQTGLPLIVDECVNTLHDLVRAKTDAGAAGVNIKPGRVGGLTPAVRLRDTAAALGMTITADETWGGSIVSNELAHFAASTSDHALLTTGLFSEWTSPDVSARPLLNADGTMTVPEGIGLGLGEIDSTHLKPLFKFSL